MKKSCTTCVNAKILSGGGWDEPPWEDFDCQAWDELDDIAKDCIMEYDMDDMYSIYPLACGNWKRG